IDNGDFDAVICECALCTFPDKAQAARGFARVLRPGGRVGISDLTRVGELPLELRGLLAWVACIADAMPRAAYEARLRDAGLGIDAVETHDEALLELVGAIQQKLSAAAWLAELGRIPLTPGDIETARSMTRSALNAVRAGLLGYAIVCATKPAAEETT
ncbi:MAG: methyltransferase domain-containing protein, partial [Candidatus Dormibacteria bacterium]